MTVAFRSATEGASAEEMSEALDKRGLARGTI